LIPLVTLLRFVFVWFLVPETKGMSLERMDDLFGVTELVKQMDIANEEHARDASTVGKEKDTATDAQVKNLGNENVVQ
jgi:histidyl-tRNA synthetase